MLKWLKNAELAAFCIIGIVLMIVGLIVDIAFFPSEAVVARNNALRVREQELRETFTDLRLKFIAADEDLRVDFDTNLNAVCSNYSGRYVLFECQALKNAGILDRWPVIRAQTELSEIAAKAKPAIAVPQN